jgi:hypothetical protein
MAYFKKRRTLQWWLAQDKKIKWDKHGRGALYEAQWRLRCYYAGDHAIQSEIKFRADCLQNNMICLEKQLAKITIVQQQPLSREELHILYMREITIKRELHNDNLAMYKLMQDKREYEHLPLIYKWPIDSIREKLMRDNRAYEQTHIIAPRSPMITTHQYYRNVRKSDYNEDNIADQWAVFLGRTQHIPFMFMETNAVEAHLQIIIKQTRDLPTDVINIVQKMVHNTLKRHRCDMMYAKGVYVPRLEALAKFGPGWDYVKQKSRNGRRVYALK